MFSSRSWTWKRADDGTLRTRCRQVILDEIRKLDHRTTPNFNEADLIFRSDGELWGVSRTKRAPDHPSLLYAGQPPYTKWDCRDLKARIHCPCLCESEGKVYVVGRRSPGAPWISQNSPPGSTGVFLVDKER